MSNSKESGAMGDAIILIVVSVFALLMLSSLLFVVSIAMDRANNRISESQGNNPVYRKIMVNMNKSLEETAVLYPGFFTQEKVVILGDEDSESINGKNILEGAENEMNMDFARYKTEALDEHDELLSDNEKVRLSNATVTLNINKGKYSLDEITLSNSN